jgi:eukaryotic-like serine/threonine-protein kinase
MRFSGTRSRLRVSGRKLLAGAVICATSLACTLLAPAPPGLAMARTTSAGSSAFDWPEFHGSPALTGYAPNSSLSTSNAPDLGVAWSTDLYGAALDSPVVAYDATLGETLAYIGTEHGDLIAVNAANGQIVWSTWLGAPIRTTPTVSDGAVWVGTVNSPRIYKVDASTGDVDCSVASPQPIEGTPVAAIPPGGVATVYFGTNDSQSASGPFLAIAAAGCSVEWSFTGYGTTSGSWDASSYAVDANGEPLILFGTADPDSSVYALDAVTGAEVWRFAAANPPPGMYDIGTGVMISPPGANGFADGVAYVGSKYGIMYALDLTTGSQIWSYGFNQALGVTEGGRSTPALDGTDLVFGYNGGILDVNALTGAQTWDYSDPAGAEVLSSPAIAGSSGSEIVAAGDLGGGFDVLSLATGTQLYHYQTGGYITASPAVTGGSILIASSDGFLYDFAVGGGNDATLPAASITTPTDQSTVANPNGDLTVQGSATDPVGVAQVDVAVQAGGQDGNWWDAATGSWVSGPVGNAATLASPGASATTWSFSYPVPAAGGTYQITADASSSSGQSDQKGAQVSVAVLTSTSGPRLRASPGFVAPGSTVTVSGGGFAKSEQVTISLLGQVLATATATQSGVLPRTKVKIATSVPFGQTTLTAVGQSSGRSAGATIVVTNNWDQIGNGSAHTGFEPNDNILFDLVHPGGDIFLDPAWMYQSGAPIDTAPAIADCVAYIANTAGQLTAVDVHNGAPLWTWNTPGGAAIGGSPAVDPSKGLVFVGADDGNVYAISTSTGMPAWSAPAAVGGDVSAPVLGGGEVYVTSSTGTVEALAESTGSTTWEASLPNAISGPPSLDQAGNTLIVGESNGDLAALAAGTGSPLWTDDIGGAIGAAAAIAAGTVYVGAGDSVYAIDEATGSQKWVYQTNGTVQDTPALSASATASGTSLLVGSGAGTLYALNVANGSVTFEVPFGQPIVGVAAVRGVTVLDTSSGLVGSARTYTDLDLWKYQTGAGITAPPAVVDGTVYVGAGDGKLYAFTSYGQLPVGAP